MRVCKDTSRYDYLIFYHISFESFFFLIFVLEKSKRYIFLIFVRYILLIFVLESLQRYLEAKFKGWGALSRRLFVAGGKTGEVIAMVGVKLKVTAMFREREMGGLQYKFGWWHSFSEHSR